jgi:hypothetical protein
MVIILFGIVDMKYSIFTTANKSYYPFLDIFTGSALANCKNLDKIYVADSGLGKYQKTIKDKNKVSILDTDCIDEYRGVHSDGWVKATQIKYLNKIFHVIDFDHPVIMIDSDVCILQDIEPIISPHYDIQVTTMSTGGHTRDDGIYISEIASFVIFNNIPKCKRFIQRWIRQMEKFSENKTSFPHETPALNITLKNNFDNLNIGYLDEIKVCADLEIVDGTYSVHFKSNGSTKDNPVVNFEKRIFSVQNKTNNDLELDGYLNEQVYADWRNEHETN